MILLIPLLFVLGLENSWALAPQVKPSSLYFGVGTEYYSTDANFDSAGGSFEGLPDGHKYQNILFNFRADIRSDSAFQYYAGLGIANATSKDNVTERDNSEVTDLRFGTYWYALEKSWLQLRPFLQLVWGLSDVSTSSTDVLTGEGAQT